MKATIFSFMPGVVEYVIDRTHWAIISAELPWQPLLSADLNRRVNIQRTNHLRRSLVRFGVENYFVIGRYDGAHELSSLLLDVSEQDALGLGVFYGQATVLVPRGLLCCKTARMTPAVSVVSLPVSTQEDHTHVFATGATFAVRFAAAQPQADKRTA